MENFIETMIMGYDKTPYKWVSGKCAETCFECEIMNGSIKPMNQWLAEGLPKNHRLMFHECGNVCACRLERV